MKRILIVLLPAPDGPTIATCLPAEGRLEDEFVARGLPQPMAGCMAERMAQRLSVLQLRKLENLQAQEGERAIPLSIAEFLERVRRVDDGEVLEVAASSAAVCAFARG